MKLRVLEHKIWLSPAPLSQMDKVGMVETDILDIWAKSIGHGQLVLHSTAPSFNWSSNQLVSLSVLGVLQTGEDCVTSVQKENMGF